MTEQQQENPQNMSPDEFFGDDTATTAGTTPQNTGSPQDISEQLRQNLGNAGAQAGKNFIIQTIVNLLPLSYRHKRHIANKINSGQSVTIWDLIFGGMGLSRIIGFVFSIIVFLIIAYIASTHGLT